MAKKSCQKHKVVLNIEDDYNGYKDFPCDVCLNKSSIPLPHSAEYTLGQRIDICKKCGFIFVRKRRSPKKIGEVWSKEMFGKTYSCKSPLMLARHTYIAEFIQQSIGLKGRRVLDIGAGEGQFLGIIKKDYGADAFGVEPSLLNCNLMKKAGINCFVGTLEEFIRSSQAVEHKPDIVTLMWTLENATFCRNIILGARKILKPGGHIVVATGSRILVPFSKPLQLYLSTNPADAHPSRFSVNTLTSLLVSSGFKAVKINPYLNDNLLLCVIAKKAPVSVDRIKGDDYRKVSDFFKRWHKESKYYKQGR